MGLNQKKKFTDKKIQKKNNNLSNKLLKNFSYKKKLSKKKIQQK